MVWTLLWSVRWVQGLQCKQNSDQIVVVAAKQGTFDLRDLAEISTPSRHRCAVSERVLHANRGVTGRGSAAAAVK